jgi:hypothetical protein
MAQRSVEIAIGRLVTDDAFRNAFLADPAAALTQFAESGYDLTPLEMAALKSTPTRVWTHAASQIDARLQKVCL